MKDTIGVDFDNTIVCYDGLFHRAALSRGLIPPEAAPGKEEVRNRLVEEGREEAWTELQGLVYGALMADADPFRGALPFFAAACRKGLPLKIISHRTKHPYAGERYDLHEAAMTWLREKGFLDPQRGGLKPEDLFFEESAEAKVARIRSAGCAHFIDDLPKVLLHKGFPGNTRRLLFDPAGREVFTPEGERLPVFGSWKEISRHFGLFDGAEGQ